MSKKKCAAESKVACKAKKAAEQAPQLEEGLVSTDPTTSDIGLPTQSAKNSKKTAAPHVAFAATHHSTRSLGSSKLGSGEKCTSAKGHNDETIATHPQCSATAAAHSLLQQLQISETESTDFKEDPDGDIGEYNNETDMIIKVLTSKNQRARMRAQVMGPMLN